LDIRTLIRISGNSEGQCQ